MGFYGIISLGYEKNGKYGDIMYNINAVLNGTFEHDKQIKGLKKEVEYYEKKLVFLNKKKECHKYKMLILKGVEFIYWGMFIFNLMVIIDLIINFGEVWHSVVLVIFEIAMVLINLIFRRFKYKYVVDEEYIKSLESRILSLKMEIEDLLENKISCIKR